MNLAPRTLFCLAAVPLLGAIAVSAAPVSPEKLAQTRARLDALYRYRLQPPPLPDARSNPFRIGDAAAVSASADPRSGAVAAPVAGAEPASTDGDAVLLKRAAETLRINGLVETGGRMIVVLNDANYKEGDVLTVRLQGSPVVLRIRQITPTQITLGLNDAETTLRIQGVPNR
jgi:hypothetical protein